MSKPFYFHYQVEGKESKWDLGLSTDRDQVIRERRPAFSTVLDLSSVPDDNDWTKVRYRGPFYADFDADGDIERVCEQFGVFLGKLDGELDFDVAQAYLYASGGKGFHIEIPAECFQPKVPETGTGWLPYIYRAMAESLMVDTLDLNVYTGKRGRQWRTTNVKRENGCYKVPLSLEEALTMTPDLYAELIRTPRSLPTVTPAVCNTKFSMLFERSKEKIVSHMRGKKRRQEKANAVLDPWRKTGVIMPTMEALMKGEGIAENVGFQRVAMQLAIYATSVQMAEAEFLDRCQGLIQGHQGDSYRYKGADRKKAELSRMWQYMSEDTLYDFEVGPVIKLLVPGTSCPDLGILDTEDKTENLPPRKTVDAEGNDLPPLVGPDLYQSVRKGFFMNSDGMFVQQGDKINCLCRAHIKDIDTFYDLETGDFKGYEFKMLERGKPTRSALLGAETFTSASAMKKFFAAYQLSFQGNDAETVALMDVLTDKSERTEGKAWIYPREGFFVVENPTTEDVEPVKVYLTQDQYQASVHPGEPDYFRLRYRPNQATSSYNIDVHRAPELALEHKAALHDFFSFSKPSVLADCIGWFVAAHYRSCYHRLFKQFPLLQVYGEAGAGKSQTVRLMAHLHWYRDEMISIKSATACTPFAMDMHASSSTSAPFIIDEYKPKELKQHRGKYEKLKDVLKAAYIMGDVGERGTVNRSAAESTLAIIKSKATAPIVFMGETIEMETAIVERCVVVNLSKSFLTKRRRDAFHRLQADPSAISALGKAIVEAGFSINFDSMKDEVEAIRARVEATLPDLDDTTRKRAGERMIYNRVVIIHALTIIQRILQRVFGTEFDEVLEMLQGARVDMGTLEDDRTVSVHAQSEISKTVSRIALLSRAEGASWEMVAGKDYVAGEGWVELKVIRGYDAYRSFCSSINDAPLFDTLDGFLHAMGAYSAVIDRVCPRSELRQDSSDEIIMRLDTRRLKLEGVQMFRT